MSGEQYNKDNQQSAINYDHETNSFARDDISECADYRHIVMENENLSMQIKEMEKQERLNNEKINKNSNEICNFEKHQLEIFTQEIRELEIQENTTRQRVEESLLELREFYSNHTQSQRQRRSEEARVQRNQQQAAYHRIPSQTHFEQQQQQRLVNANTLNYYQQQITTEMSTINNLMAYRQQLRFDAVSQQREQEVTNQLIADIRELLLANSQELRAQQEQTDCSEDLEDITLTN